jgi:hypothetical protein
VKWERGEGVFIGPENSGRPAKVAYVRYYYTAVQRLFRTSRYYPDDILKSSVHLVLLGVRPCTILIVRYTICQRMSSGPPAYVHGKGQERTSAKGLESSIRLG